MKKLLVCSLIFIALVTAICAVAKTSRTNRSAKTVKTEQRENQKQIAKTKKDIEENTKRTRRQLNELNSLQGEILRQKGDIQRLQTSVDSFNREITLVEDTIKLIENNISRLKKSYAQSLRKKRANKQSLGTLDFIFSAQSFSNAFKRIGYLKQSEKWQRVKVDQLNNQKQLLDLKCIGLSELHEALTKQLTELGAAHKELEVKEVNTAKAVTKLKAEGATLKTVLAERQKKAQSLSRELDRIIAEEARRAEAERKAEEQRRKEAERKAEEQRRKEAERKAEEQRRKEAERRAQEEKKAAEEKKKAEAKKQTEANKSANTKPAEQGSPKTPVTKQETKPSLAESKKPETASSPTPSPSSTSSANTNAKATSTASTSVAPTSGGFAQNKGRLIFPVSGNYNIVGQFGRNQHSELSHIEIENSGIDIQTSEGSSARAVFGGTVSSIFHLDGFQNIVILRHGDYLTVYAGIANLKVKKGETVKAGQNIGTIFTDTSDGDKRTILHFEVRHEKQKLNPLEWVRQ